MSVLVTGASGFIGHHVVRTLRSRGEDVVATGRRAGALQPLQEAGARVVTANLATDSLREMVRGCHAVVHCAAMAAPWGKRDAFVRDNVTATERLLEAAAEAGVQRFVHISSPSIYSAFEHQVNVDEAFTAPARWANPYGETKWLSEQRVFDPRFASLQPVALRPRAVFGEGDRAIVPRVLAVARRGRFPLIDGGASLIDVTYVGNVVSAIETALSTPRENCGRAYNITNGEPMAVRELLTKLFGAPRRKSSLCAAAAAGGIHRCAGVGGDCRASAERRRATTHAIWNRATDLQHDVGHRCRARAARLHAERIGGRRTETLRGLVETPWHALSGRCSKSGTVCIRNAALCEEGAGDCVSSLPWSVC